MKLTHLNLQLATGQSRAEPFTATLEKIETLPEQNAKDLQIIPVVMNAEERRKVRRRVTFLDGVEIGLALPTGTVLIPGTIVYKTSAKAYIVEAALERVLVVRPKGLVESAKIAHFIGNLHRDIDMQADELVVLYEPALEIRLQKLGYTVSRDDRVFMGRPTGSDAHQL